MGNGTHWMGLNIENKNCVCFDSYGMLPPEEIISFCKRIPKSHLSYNTKEIQDLNAKKCGFFAIAFIIFLHTNTSEDLYKRSSFFSDLFLLDTKLNNKKLQRFFRLLLNQSTLPILKKLYSQQWFSICHLILYVWKIKKTIKALVYGRENISPNVDKFVRDHGGEPLLEIIISRNVVSSLLTGFMKLISSKFSCFWWIISFEISDQNYIF